MWEGDIRDDGVPVSPTRLCRGDAWSSNSWETGPTRWSPSLSPQPSRDLQLPLPAKPAPGTLHPSSSSLKVPTSFRGLPGFLSGSL